jgi:hypothetical protein
VQLQYARFYFGTYTAAPQRQKSRTPSHSPTLRQLESGKTGISADSEHFFVIARFLSVGLHLPFRLPIALLLVGRSKTPKFLTIRNYLSYIMELNPQPLNRTLPNNITDSKDDLLLA